MGIYVIMDDDSQTAYPVEASTPDEARAVIAEKFGKVFDDQPIYDGEDEGDLEAIVSILAHRR